jgi:predicted transcriptional regulator
VGYTGGMEIELSPELQAKLERIASEQGRDSKSLVHEAVERLVGYDEWFIRQVEKGLAQVDGGEVLEDKEVAAHMENLIRQNSAASDASSAEELQPGQIIFPASAHLGSGALLVSD